ncbi:hypothetical protein VM1G_08371 [Cytospora mali]|uniref:Uncharacterized protein n=1 Tax=Cytospora mali TaxID=578113 RepID=A0A194W9Y2_CYTMA|nr:hypothetical protein VM1G_08371 [Valsa mali]
MGKKKRSKPRKQRGMNSAQLSEIDAMADSSSDSIQPSPDMTLSEGEASETATRTPAAGSESNASPTNESAESSVPVSHPEIATEDLDNPGIESQAGESTDEGFVPSPSGEEPEDADTPTTGSIPLSDTARASDDAGVPEDAGADFDTSSAEVQPETMVAAHDEMQSQDADVNVGMVQDMDIGRETSHTDDNENEAGNMVEGSSRLDATDVEGELAEENEKDRGEGGDRISQHGEEAEGDPGTDQSPLQSLQEELQLEQRKNQELRSDFENALGTPTAPNSETFRRSSRAAKTDINGIIRGPNLEREEADNITVAPGRKHRSMSMLARPLLSHTSHLLEGNTQISRIIASIANYIDGVGDMPSKEDRDEFERFKNFTAQRARVLEEMLKGDEPLAAIERFDSRWGQEAWDPAWGLRLDLRLAAVRAATYIRYGEVFSPQHEMAIMYFEHSVAVLRERLGGNLDDPVVLQTEDLLNAFVRQS